MKNNIKIESILASKVNVGDILSVNTGYRPLDDEYCKILSIEERTGFFGDSCIIFFIESRYGNHEWEVPKYMVYGPNVYETMVSKVTLT